MSSSQDRQFDETKPSAGPSCRQLSCQTKGISAVKAKARIQAWREAMTNIGASEAKRARSSVDNRKRYNWVRPDKLEIPSNINSPVLNLPTLVVLDAPNFIRATPSTILTASHIQAGKSTATMRYRIQEGENVDAYVRFHFWWTNSGSKPVSLANITSRFVINGFWETYASCSYIAPNWNYVYLDSDARLNIIEFWNQPPTSPPVENDQYTTVAFLEIEGGLCETDPPPRQTRRSTFLIRVMILNIVPPLSCRPRELCFLKCS
jgi:hypothetical protein